MMFKGVNAAGGDVAYGEANTTNPVSNTDFLFISNQDIDYLVAKKINFVRFLFSWECMQPTLNGPLATNTYATQMKARVDYMTGKGLTVMIEPHGGSDTNFAKYKGNLVGSTAVPNAAFGDFWSRMANLYKDNAKVVYGLTNEPSNMSTMQWFNAAQAAVTGIRSTGSTQMIMVPGNGWTGAASWNDNWYDTASTKTSNAKGWLTLKDPANNMVCSVHMYMDPDAGGGVNDIVSATVGVERLDVAVKWARTNKIKIHIGEFGASTANALSATAIKNVLDYVQANQDVIIGWAWWAYGPPSWWGSYRFTLCPTSNYTKDDAKWAWLTPYLTDTSSPPVVVPPNSPYLPVTYDSNGFFHLNSGQGDYVGYKPDNYNDSTPISLFVWMHGCGGQAEGDMWAICPTATRQTQSYIAISLGGRDGDCWQPGNDNAKVLAAITDVKKYFNINPKRIYLGGYSSGGDMTYRVGFENAGIFAGLLVENSDPFRDTGSTSSALMSAASWKINVAHLAHLQDTTYPIATVRASINTLKTNGFQTTLMEKNGTHWDDDTGTTGTNYDLRTSLLPYLDAGWELNKVPATPVPPDPTAPVVTPPALNIVATTTHYPAPGDQGFTSKKVIPDGYSVPKGTYNLTAATRTIYGDDNSVSVEFILYSDQKAYDLTWESMTVDLRGHTINNFWGCTVTGTSGIVTVTPTADTKLVRAQNKNACGFNFQRMADVNKKYYQVLVKSIKW